jgi:hypothetical protein
MVGGGSFMNLNMLRRMCWIGLVSSDLPALAQWNRNMTMEQGNDVSQFQYLLD